MSARFGRLVRPALRTGNEIDANGWIARFCNWSLPSKETGAGGLVSQMWVLRRAQVENKRALAMSETIFVFIVLQRDHRE